MHRNTFLIVSLLAVAAALIIGVNAGRKIGGGNTQIVIPPTIPSVPSATSTPKQLFYQNKTCGISFSYPPNLTEISSPQGGIMVNKENPNESIAVACQADIPRPALIPERIENVKIGTVSANIYHDASPKDGSPIDEIIFTHPTKKTDVFISGYGQAFQSVIKTLQIQ